MESAVGVQIQTGPSMQGMQQAHGRKSEWRVVGEGAGVAGSSSGSSQQQGRLVDGGAGVGGGQSRVTAARARSNPGGVGAGGPRNSNRSRNGRLFNPNSSTHSSDSENQERLSGVGESQAMSSVTQDSMSKPSGGRAEVYSEMRHQHNHVALHVAQLSAAPSLGGDDSEEVIQQKLHEYASQQERMRQYEVELRAQMLARSEVARTQSAYDEQIKRCSDLEGQLQAVRSQLQEKEEQIQQLQQQVQQLRETQMQTNEAAWAKEGLLREQSNELLTLRAERDSAIAEGNAKAALCEEERAEHVKQVEELKEQINEKDRQLEAAKEQAREQQEMLWNKEEQLRETAAWALRAQELEMLHMSLATDLREKHEQLNQLWAVHQRQSQQLTESERYHQMVIAGLQAEVREQSRVLGGGKTLPTAATLAGNDQKHERNGSVGQTIGDSLVSGESHSGAEGGSQTRGLRSVGAGAAVVSARTKLAVSAPGVIDAVIPVVIPRDAPSKVEQATGVPVVTPPILSLAPGMPPPGPLSAQLHLHMHQPTAVPSPHHMHQAAIQVGPHQQQVASLQQIPVLTSQQHYATQNSIQPQAIVQHQSQLQQQQALQAQRGQHRQLMQRPVQVQQQQQQQQQPHQQEEATTHAGQVAQQAQSQGMSQTSLGQHHHVQHHQSSSQQHSQSHQAVHHHQQLQATHQLQLQSHHHHQQQQLVQQQDQQQQEQQQVLRQQDKQQEQQHLQPQTQHRSEQEEKQLQFQEHLQDQAHHLEGGQVGLMQQPHVSTESHMVGQQQQQQQQQGGGQGGHVQHPQVITMLNKGQTYPSQHLVEMHPHGPAVGSHFPGQQSSHLTYHHQQQPQSRFLQASRQIMPHALQQGTQQIGQTQPQQQSQQQQQPDQQTQQQQFPVSSVMQAQSQQHEQHGQNVQTMSDQVHGSVLVQQQQAVSLVAKQQNVQEVSAQPQAHTAPVQSETMPGQSHMSQGDQSVHLQHQQGLQAAEQMGMVSSSVGLMGPGAVPSAIQAQQNQFVQGQQGLSAASRTSECHQEREVTVSAEGQSGKTSSIELAGNRPAAHTQLLDEKALLQCLFRIIPSSDPKDALKISTTVANRLTKFLAPLHWHDYRKQYGRLDEFLASHSECFVLLDNDHVCLQEGARSVISGLAVSARAAAVAAAGVQTAMSSISPTVVVTPVSAQAAMRSRGLRPGMPMVPVSRDKIMNLGSQPSTGVSNTGSGAGNNNPHGSVVGGTSDVTTKSICVPVSGAESTGMGDDQVLNTRSGSMSNGFGVMRNSPSNGPQGMNSAVNGGHPLGGGAGSSGINVRGAQPLSGSKVNGMLSANGIIGPPAGVGNGVMNGHVMSGGNQRGGAYGYAAVRANTR